MLRKIFYTISKCNKLTNCCINRVYTVSDVWILLSVEQLLAWWDDDLRKVAVGI